MLDADWVYFRVAPKDMTFVNRIIEGCGYLASHSPRWERRHRFVPDDADTAGRRVTF